MKKQKKLVGRRLLALILTVTMLLGMMPVTAFGADGQNEPVKAELTNLQIRVGGENTSEAAIRFTPEFDENTLTYTSEILDYEKDANKRFVWVNAEFPERVTVTAKCGNSSTALLTDGEWTIVRIESGGGFFQPVSYSGPLSTGKYNELMLTASTETGEKTTYTVTIPMQPDIENRKLSWKEDLTDAIYYTKDSEGNVLAVKAQYNNRPLDNQDEITYQWYRNRENGLEGAVIIEGATGTSFEPPVDAVGKTYYFVKAFCDELDTIVSNIIEITVTEETAPESINIVCDYPYTIPNSDTRALEGKSFVAKPGETLQLKAVDENGNETPVFWDGSGGVYGGTLDRTTGLYTINNTSYSYIKAVSLYDNSVKSNENVIFVEDYSINQYNKTPFVALDEDGQDVVKITGQGGLSGYTIWDYQCSNDNIATLKTDLETKPARLEFEALRPGTIEISFDLDLDGDGIADGNGLTDSAVLTINGVAVEDAAGNLRETRMEISKTVTNPAIQLTAYTAAGRTIAEWKSGDEAVATVDENGVVTAHGAGNTIISAKDDQGEEGGIKVIVTNEDVPYFENFAFTKANSSWNPGIYGLTFKATTLEYPGLTCNAATNDIQILPTTIFDDEKYTATATYSDWHGNDMVVPVKRGEETTLEDIFFGEGTITVTLQSKEDPEVKTVYTFGITRAWDTQKQIKASNGIAVVADGRELSTNLYEGRGEGFVFRANADGTLMGNLYIPINSHYNYRSFLQNGLERFALNILGYTDYVHIRYSSDEGETWYDLPQGGGQTRMFEFPERESDTNPVMKVMIQILDDKTYAENVAAEKDGFDGASPNVYTVWVEQLPATGMEMTEAILSHGISYPAFDKETYSYNIMVNADEEAPTLTFKVSEGGAVSVGGTVLTANEDGSYTITLTKNYQSIVITNELGSATYQFRYTSRANSKLPDKVVDYLPINSQYTNQAQYGLTPEKTLTATNDVLSLGNFGGHITYYYEEALIDDPNNKYGIDFYITGNAFVDQSTGTGKGSMEPGQVWVSEDGEIWYALAGSEHYEDTTLWDYEVTYKKTELGMTSWKDNQGNQDNGKQVGQWPSTANYPLNDQISDGEVTLRGILIPCNDGSLTGNGTFNSFSKGAKFGYVDVLVNSRDGEDANPYLENDDYELESSGFDLAWAVDEDGLPVDVSEKEFHYVKIVTASNLWAGAANEKSTEVGNMFRTTAQETDMGVTASPTGVTITDGTTTETIEFEDGTQVYELNLTEMQYVSISVDGASADDNIYINNQRVEADEAAEGIQVTKNGKLVRVIVQNGDKAPVIYVLKLKSLAEDSLISAIKVDALGVDKVAETKDGKTYTVEVGHRVDVTSIDVTVPEGTEVTVDGEAVKESYSLEEGDNTFEITAVSDEAIQTVILIVNKEKAPEVTGKITVSFTLLGDDNHGDVTKETGTHTLKSKNLETWISKTKYTIDAPANVLDLLEVALTDHDIDWVNVGGNYISEINGLAEFDNGPLSGWMYTIDGKHPERGVFVQPLENGDNVVFHYTDDYTVEEGSEKYGNNAYVEEVGSEEMTNTTMLTPSASTNSKGEASVTIKKDELASAVEEATKDNTAGTVVIAPEIKGDASKVTVELPKEAVDSMATSGKVDLTVKTDIATVTLPAETLKELPTEGKTVSVAVEKSEDKIKVEVAVDNKAVDKIGSGVVASIPVKEASATTVLAIVDAEGNETIVKKSAVADGEITALLEGSCTVIVKDNKKEFADTEGHWGKAAAEFASSRELFNGVGNGQFGMNTTMNRAMMATVFYNLENGPDHDGEHDFHDVDENRYYAKPVAWAAESGVLSGYSDGSFRPDAPITREQLAVMLWNYSGKPGADKTKALGFSDASEISKYAETAMKWAVENGVMSGRTNGQLDPKGEATRAEVAQMFKNYIEKVVL